MILLYILNWELYKLSYDEFKFESYLSSTKNLNYTLAFFHFRISSHNLRIKTGHYARPKILVNERMCIYCKSQAVEIVAFPPRMLLFIKERREFLEKVNMYQRDLNYASNEHKFIA